MLKRLAKVSTNIVMLVSSQQRTDDRARELLISRSVRQALLEAGKLAAERQLTAGPLAEISVRLPGDKFAINKEGSWFPHLQEGDFTAASLKHDRKVIENISPSKHADWHRIAYNTTAAGAVLLCQPVSVLLAAELSLPPSAQLLSEAASVTGEIAFVEAVDSDIQQALTSHHALVIRGCGLFVCGNDIYQILATAETIEQWFRLTLAQENYKARGYG